MSQQGTARSYADAQTRTTATAGAMFANRELGPQSGVPLVLLTHLEANLDGWDRASSTGSRIDPLFFTSTATGRRAARAYPARLEGTHDRARQALTPGEVSRAVDCGAPPGAAGSRRMVVGVGQVLIVHGASDRLLPPANPTELASFFPARR